MSAQSVVNAQRAVVTEAQAASLPIVKAKAQSALDEAIAFADWVPAAATLPAWHKAMAETDRLYTVSAKGPSEADQKIVFPHGGVVPSGFTTNEQYADDVLLGYSSGSIVDVGEHGTMVFGTGGHTRIQNQLLSLSISDDSPMWGWFQQPTFEVAEVNGAELYYNLAEFTALPANRRTGGRNGDETAMTAAWLADGGKFPMGYGGWIFPRKQMYGTLGNSTPHGFRYQAPNGIPASMTGTGAGGYVCIPAGQGPFGQSYLPYGAQPKDLYDASVLWPSGRRKWPVHVKNVLTGAWTRLPGWKPDYLHYGYTPGSSAVSVDQKRVYVSADEQNGTAVWWYVDFTGGVAGATISPLIRPKTGVSPGRSTSGAFTDGHPDQRHLWYWPDAHNSTGLIVQDLDAGTQTQLPIGKGLAFVAGNVGMQYDAARNRIIVLQSYADEVFKYVTIAIPSNPYDVAGYVVVEKTLTIDSSVTRPVVAHRFFSKTRFHPTLGVMFVPTGTMLAFRPS